MTYGQRTRTQAKALESVIRRREKELRQLTQAERKALKLKAERVRQQLKGHYE